MGFQSLFSWNLPSDLYRFGDPGGQILFQSLFSWNLPSDGMENPYRDTDTLVSILVFVELALGRCCRAAICSL